MGDVGRKRGPSAGVLTKVRDADGYAKDSSRSLFLLRVVGFDLAFSLKNQAKGGQP